jgi:uncharacterized membrane protein HdeD (DUF308 family)
LVLLLTNATAGAVVMALLIGMLAVLMSVACLVSAMRLRRLVQEIARPEIS